MTDTRAVLYDAAMRHARDIAVADYLTVGIGGSKIATPGQVINWTLRLAGEAMRKKAEELRGLWTEYDHSRGEKPFNALEDAWKGSGGLTFRARWEGFTEHISKLSGFLDIQVDDMRRLAEGCDGFQNTVAKLIVSELGDVNGKGLREAYIDALTHDAEGAITLKKFTESVGGYSDAGKSIGELAGTPTAFFGSALGAVVGAVMAFLEESEKSARDQLHIADLNKQFTLTMEEMSSKLDVMDRSRYAAGPGSGEPGSGGYGETKYEPFKDADTHARWE